MESDKPQDDRVDLYLDGLMSDQEVTEFVQSTDAKELGQTMELQEKIDNSLKRMLSGLNVDQQEIEAQFLRTGAGGLAPARSVSTDLSRGQLIKFAVAAVLMVAVGLGVWLATQPRSVNPVFQPVALTKLYAQKVLDYRPYYFCEDDQRFADTFSKRFGVALALAEMPSDRSMLGLSYLGGIDRDTVAMLCKVQDENVIVFVDREGAPGIDVAIESTDPTLNVFVERKFGLVFAEVSPLESSTMVEYFELAD